MKTKQQIDEFITELNTLCLKHDMILFPFEEALVLTDSFITDPDTGENVRSYYQSYAGKVAHSLNNNILASLIPNTKAAIAITERDKPKIKAIIDRATERN